MNQEQELQDLRRKYTALTQRYDATVDRLRVVEATNTALVASNTEILRRIQNLEADFDRKAQRDIGVVRELRDTIASTPR